MYFRYMDYSVELLLMGIEYPIYPSKLGERAVSAWQITIINDYDEDFKIIRIKKGAKRDVIYQIKKYIREIEGDEIFDEDEEEF